MNSPVVWFEILGQDEAKLKAFYSEVLGWSYKPSGHEGYEMIQPSSTGIPGGIGKAKECPGWTTFYVQVKDLPAAIACAEKLGGKVILPPTSVDSKLTIAVLTDPEGHTIGLCT